MIDKKQRLLLRSKAMNIKPTVWIGKEGLSASVMQQIGQELYDHELVKITLSDNTDALTEFDQAQLATTLGADIVTVIGKKVVLYKPSDKKGIKKIFE